MTYEEYWYGDPLMVRAFYKAEKLRQKRRDEDAWLNGLYVLRALDAIVGNAFRKEGTVPSKYPTKPIYYEIEAENGEESEQAKEKREEEEANYALAYMTNMVMAGAGWDRNKNRTKIQ